MTRTIGEGQRRWLLGELGVWQESGLLGPEQAAGILALYGTPEEAAARRGARALFTLTSLAAVLVGLAVFLLVGYNWEAMPAAVKLAIILAVLLGTHAAGFLLRERLGRPRASEVAFFLACLFDGAAIWLVAQIFHINAGDADGFWWWSLGALPFALCLDTVLMHALLAVLLALFAGFSALGFAPEGNSLLSWLGLPVGGAYSVPLLALPGLLWAYRKHSPMTVALYAPLLAWWVILQPFAWRFEVNPVYFIGGVGGLLLLLAECHDEESRMAIPFRFYGALLAVGAMVPLSYYTFHKHLQLDGGFSGLFVELAGIVLLASLTVWLAIRQRQTTGEPAFRPRAFLGRVRILLPMGVIALMVFLAFWNAVVQRPLVPTLLTNLALVALALWLMHIGLREDRGFPFTAGVLLFLFWAVLRYIDLFGDFGGMLGASLMFFLCGATLFGVAQYWRGRKEVGHG